LEAGWDRSLSGRDGKEKIPVRARNGDSTVQDVIYKTLAEYRI